MSKPSVILLGSKPAARIALNLMLKLNWDIRAVISSDKEFHDFIGGPKMSQLAHEAGIPVLKKQSELQNIGEVDFVISYMFRDLVKNPTLKLAKRAALNFHAGPLPDFGGWAFYNIAILENASEYGCTCHHMDDGFDTGPLLKVRRFPINAKEETAWSLERKAQQEMMELFIEFLALAESGKDIPKIEQDKSLMRYLDKESFDKLKEIPQNADEETIDRHARAFFYPPYDCAFVRIGETKVEVLPSKVKQTLAEYLHANDFKCLRDLDSVSTILND
jgi:methionyl-tRNA formyltransferase